MFARKVAARLKADSLVKFTHLIEREILPWLRRQEGFLDLIILVAPDGSEVATLSFWDRPENEKAYNASCYPEVLRTLGDLFDSPPYVKTFDVVSSTLHRTTQSESARADELPNEVTAAQDYRSCETHP